MITYKMVNDMSLVATSNIHTVCGYFKRSGNNPVNQQTKFKYLKSIKINTLLTTTLAVNVLTIRVSGLLL
jgi:hypothetical protein